jgi:hypothetical protein
MKAQTEGLNARTGAKYVGVSTPTFLKSVLPEVPHKRVGRRIVVSKTALDVWMNGEQR